MVTEVTDFIEKFKNLTGHIPFLWQQDLYQSYFATGNIPDALDIPTGMGKTSVIALWYLSLKAGSRVPRRLVYIVDRRAVVDQATTEALNIRENAQDSQLRISTLRGQHIDNREWLTHPAAPAIIIGTVDMIGSRLLFSGYGVSRKMRPYHAGLLGVDCLIVLDESHLVPSFKKLLETITTKSSVFGGQNHSHSDYSTFIKPPHLLSLSATQCEDEDQKNTSKIFRLSHTHKMDKVIKKRLESPKILNIRVCEDPHQLVEDLVDQAWQLRHRAQRVLIFCQSRQNAIKVKKQLDKKAKKDKFSWSSELLVGARRLYERERLSQWLEQYGFIGESQSQPQTAFLIATSAGEVGIDMDCDHMVCDLVEWERMIQRLGRVNRKGEGQATVQVIAAPPENKKKANDLDGYKRLKRLRAPLDALPQKDPLVSLTQDHESRESDPVQPRFHDASPSALLSLKEKAMNDPELLKTLNAAVTPQPLRPALTRPLIDAWALTSATHHTGRPENIQPWLRGWEKESTPQATLVWRKYLPIRDDGEESDKSDIEAFFEAAPPHAREGLETDIISIHNFLKRKGKDQKHSKRQESPFRANDIIAYVLSSSLEHRLTLRGQDLKQKLDQKLAGTIIILDQRLGGLSPEGMLDEKSYNLMPVMDGDEWLLDDSSMADFRIHSSKDPRPQDKDWCERARFVTKQTQEGEASAWLIVEGYIGKPTTEEERSVGTLQELDVHHAYTEEKARHLASELKINQPYTRMLATAARLHDQGKRAAHWQQAFHAPADGKIYAKTPGPVNLKKLAGYRHEFGSLGYIEDDEGFQTLSEDLKELVRHLIASHHGWARPHLCIQGCDGPPSTLEKRARDVALRFAHLQKHWGPWVLAWWETLLRSADQQASRQERITSG